VAGFTSSRDYVDSIDAGRTTFHTWRKQASQTTLTGIWFDLSMSPGIPLPQYYASSPLVSSTVTAQGLYTGGAVSPRTKHLASLTALTAVATALPVRLMLMDYLLYYPFIDMGTNEEQAMENTVTIPRYSSAQVMPVMVGAQAVGGVQFQIGYTNQDGTAGRTSQIVTCNTATGTGSIIHSGPNPVTPYGPFIPLQSGDTGVRSIETVTMTSGTDVGLIAMVLVKPLASLTLLEPTAPVETDLLLDAPSLPEIKDGAYLNFAMCPQGNMAGTPLHGHLTTVWS
jgi:hypothetical protein